MRHANRKAACARDTPEWTIWFLRFVALSRDGHGHSMAVCGIQQRLNEDLIRGTVPSAATQNRSLASGIQWKNTRSWRPRTFSTRESRQRTSVLLRSLGRKINGRRSAWMIWQVDVATEQTQTVYGVGAGRSATGGGTTRSSVRSEWPWGAGTRKPGASTERPARGGPPRGYREGDAD